ncbi:MAG: glycoside hydrolase family 13 protein [Anaeromyxobacter sp.]
MGAALPTWLGSLAFDIAPDYVKPLCPALGEPLELSFRLWKEAPIRKAMLHCRLDGEYHNRAFSRAGDGRRFTTWTLPLTQREPELRFSLILDSDDGVFFVNRAGAGRFHPVADGDFVVLADQRPPLWFTEGSTYQIFPDRFHRARRSHGVKAGEYVFDGVATREMAWGDRPPSYAEARCLDFYNGDLDGIRKKLPYLAGLGVRTLYLNPIFAARTIHRYDCIDYLHVDPHLGGDPALRRLTAAAHQAGLRVVLDVSINHTGSDHPWARAAAADPAAPEAGFYHRTPEGRLQGWWDVPTLPQLDYRSARLRKLVWEGKASAVRKWLRAPYAIDGWRFDVGDQTARRGPVQLGHEVFRGVRKAVKEENPEALIVGEAWQDPADYLRGDQWDGFMNYAACARPLRAFAGERDRYVDGTTPRPVVADFPLSGADTVAMIRAYYARLPHLAPYLAMNMLDSHDLYRLHTFPALHEPGLYRGLVVAQFLLPGSPSVYYGDEVGLGGWPEDMEGVRLPMEWSERRWRPEFTGLYRPLVALRAREEALRLGALRFLHVDDDRILLGRFLGETAVLGLVSRAGAPAEITLDAALHGLAALEPLLEPSAGSSLELVEGRLALKDGGRGSGVWKARVER